MPLPTSIVRARERVEDRLHLSTAGLIALTAAVATVVAAVAVLADTSEDVVGGDGITTKDPSVLRAVTAYRPGWLVAAARTATDIGAVEVLAVVAVLAGVVLWWRNSKLAFALTPVVALGAAGVCAFIGKLAVGRMRPPLGFRLVPESGSSFPSGHATDSAGLFIALGLVLAVGVLHSPRLRVLAAAAGVTVAALIGASRLELGVHWPTDVLAGWSVGLTVAVTVTTLAALAAHAGGIDPVTGLRRSPSRLFAVLSAQRRPVAAR